MGCTLATGAGDREFVDRLDLDFTLRGMSGAHDMGETLDVALVALQEGDRQALRARARVILPARHEMSVERVLLSRAISNETLRVLFYVDSNDDNRFNESRQEHVWFDDVPATGVLSFTHSNMFEKFDQDTPTKIGGDALFSLPPLAQALGRSCLEARVRDTLEVAVFFEPAGRRVQVGYWKTYRENGLPATPVRLTGIIDAGTEHGIEVTVDGVRGPTISLGNASEAGLTVPFETWFPVDDASRPACTVLR